MTDLYNRIDRRTRKVLELDYSSYRQDFDPLKVLFESAIHIVRTARAIQAKDAVSYRGLLVGSCALMNNVQDGILRAYVGFNNTPEKGAPKSIVLK
jgi:hypothetical protein